MADKIKSLKIKKLCKDSQNKMLSGVLAGFANYYNIDATLLRVIFAFFMIFTGLFPGLLLYLVAAFIMTAK